MDNINLGDYLNVTTWINHYDNLIKSFFNKKLAFLKSLYVMHISSSQLNFTSSQGCMSSQGFCTCHFIDASGYAHNLYTLSSNSNLTLNVEINDFLGWLHLSLGRKWLGFSINDMQIFLMPLFPQLFHSIFTTCSHFKP